ncbi:MAG TPA: hypothetical protein VF304_10675, partial [Casimicrobiaceae bacterium]
MTIGYDQEHSYELSVELAKAGLRPSFSLGEVLRFAGAPPNVASSFQVTEPNVLGQCVEKLAQALWKYGADLLRNDKNAFIKLTRFRNKESYEYELESRLRHARSLAEDAWQKRDYVAVVSALLPWSHVLSPSEKKRLEYSRKQV